jgi:RimJ/RimL family protein N-acetyltransferase
VDAVAMTDANLTESTSVPIVTIEGTRAALGPLSRTYLGHFHRWFNDMEVMTTYSIRWSPQSEEGADAWYRRVSDDRQAVAFMVYKRPEMMPIGYSMLLNINHYHQTADFDIILGEKAIWGQGFGTEATQLTLDYAFTALNLHSVMLTVRAFNERGLRAYERAGFRLFGRRRQARQLAGQRYDVLYMECLASEFQSPVLHRLVPK